jgi:hypothetical protein
MISIIVLAKQMGLRTSTRTTSTGCAARRRRCPTGYDQDPVIAQIAERSSTASRRASTSVTMTGIILVLAANTAFNGFPVLGSILAQDGYAAAAAAHARRPARLQQRHRLPGRDGDHPDRSRSTPRSPG